MSAPTTSIGFSPSTPAPSPGYQNTIPQSDGGTPLQKVSEQVPNTGGAAIKTANYTLQASDCGFLLAASSSSAITFLLPAVIPFSKWTVKITNMGSAPLTISPNGLQMDGLSGSGANLTLGSFQGITIQTDGTNYFSQRGLASGYATIAGVQQQSYTYAADTGSANAYVVSLTPAPTLVAGSVVQFKAANANTGGSTLKVNSGVAIAINKQGALPLVGGEISAGQIVEVVYDGTNFQLLANGSGGAGNMNYTGGGAPWLSVTNPTLTTFAWRNQGSATVTNNSADIWLDAVTAISGNSIIGREISASAAPFSIKAGMLPATWAVGYGGIYVTDGTKLVVLLAGYNSSGAMAIAIDEFNSVTSFASQPFASQAVGWGSSPLFLKIYDDGTLLHFMWSPNGNNWVDTGYTQGRTSFLSSVSKFGFFVNSNGTTFPAKLDLISWTTGTS